MDQEELERRVKEIWARQGFEVNEGSSGFTAVKDGVEKRLHVFSSKTYTEEDVKEQVDSGSLVFVDDGLASVSEALGNEVSVINQPEEVKEYDRPSYEIIGDIAVISDLDGRDRDEAVEGIRHHHPHVETVILKQEPLSGEYRVGGYEKLYGNSTETVHTEFGCRYRVDPTEVYFSERFATERKRVIDQIEDGERVLIMGAGVGPFAVLAARHGKPSRVVAVEKNPAAFEYLEENIELNGVEDTVEAVKADGKKFLEQPGEEFDRVIIPIPETAEEFLAAAIKHVAPGGVVHHYSFIEDEDWDAVLAEVGDAAEEAGRAYKVIGKTVCGNRGPSVDRVCVDLRMD